MSDFNEEFHLVLGKHSAKKSSAIYNDNIMITKPSYKPQDVISIVSHQLNAIQRADSLKSTKGPSKELYKFKNSKFLSVNNFSMLVEELPKQTTKFDTQCVTDTQLLHIIEDAEILDVHQGMTQEFETVFTHHTEKQGDEHVVIKNDGDGDMDECEVDTVTENIEKATQKSGDIEQNNDIKESIGTDTHNVEDKDRTLEYMSQIVNKPNNKCSNFLKSKDFQQISNTVCCTVTNINDNENSDYDSSKVEQLSQVLQTKVDKISKKRDKAVKIENKNSSKVVDYSQVDIEIKDDNAERPPSPIFINKNVKMKSKSPSPLVYNLDQFEHFETIALSFLTCDNINNAKHIINSQILNKELQINKDIEFLNSNIVSPILHEKVDKEEHSRLPDNKIIEGTAQATSKTILKQSSHPNFEDNAEINSITAHGFSNDEILFSSDEEESYVHREVQDLPFTCALDSSICNQSDILDKTLYVGFQTASNRSIQVGAGSFARAKSLLSVSTDDITVTELVNNCESADNNRSALERGRTNMNDEGENFNTGKINIKQSKITNLKTLPNNKMGFMTASNKSINLSQKSLSRCRKVFQDIDLNEDFNDVHVKEDLLEMEIGSEANNKNNDYDHDHKLPIMKEDTDSVSCDLEGFDDEIIQEFENIEMSLEDFKENKGVTPRPKTSNCNNISKDILNELNISSPKDLNKNSSKENISIDTMLTQIIGNQHQKNGTKSSDPKTSSNRQTNIPTEVNLKISDSDCPKEISKPIEATEITVPDIMPLATCETGFVGFKTASNKGIQISDNALIRSAEIFKDIDCVENNIEKLHKDNSNSQKCQAGIEVMSPSQPSTSKGFLGFKTANNKNINISEKAWRKSKNVFNNIDSMELPKKANREHSNDSVMNISNISGKGNLNKTGDHLAGIEITNIETHISGERPANTKITLNDDISSDFVLSTKLNDPENIDFTDTEKQLGDLTSAASSIEFVGFKSASNKATKVSEKALAQTRNLFNDIDSEFSKECITAIEMDIDSTESKTRFSSKACTETKFVGFKTANNKNIQISNEALTKTKDIFKDIDSECKLVSKTSKKYYSCEEPNAIDVDGHQGLKMLPAAAGKKSFEGIEGPVGSNIDASRKNDNLISQVFKGIHTASKKSVSLSVKENTVFTGFQTASNKQVKISEKALANSRKIFKDIDNIENINAYNENTKVKALYPEELLQKNPITMEVTDDFAVSGGKNIIRGFKGFQTASKKPVTISKSALEKSKMLFKDLDEQKSDNILESNEFTGFQTASNKQVLISEKALSKSRKIFKDIDNIGNINAEDKITKVKALYPEEILQENQINLAVTNTLVVNESKNTVGRFKGFQTASKKPVTISKSALEKSKKLFNGLDEVNYETSEFSKSGKNRGDEKVSDENKRTKSLISRTTTSNKKENNDKDVITKTQNIKNYEIQENVKPNINFGFQTGNNKAIAISEDALVKSKRLLSELDDEGSIRKRNKTQGTEDIRAMLDTQVINNFEESLHTEDFVDPSKAYKRAGSPILSCPRAKKRKKFETPYTTKNLAKTIVNTIEEVKLKTHEVSYIEDYKKKKKLTLKDLDNMTKNIRKVIDPYLTKFEYDNLLKFQFNHNRNDITNDNMTIETLKEYFLNSVNAKLVPNGWLDNHIQLILWKLISYEVKFKSAIVCTARNVLDQLKFRYDKELYNAQRPALRKIYEKDDVPSKTMVLCVVGIYVDGVLMSSVTNSSSTIELLLTDGWYSIRCNIDKMLTQLVCSGKVTAGCKIVTSGAEVVGSEQGVSPWEDTSAIRLKIYGNSTRRARWDTRLGYLSSGPMLCQLSSIQVLGGKVSRLRVFVTRVYPALYVEKFEDGSTVTRSERLENIHQMKAEAERQAFMEKLYEEVEKEFNDQNSQDSGGLSDSHKHNMESGSQIARMMKRSKDPVEFRAHLGDSQLRLLEAHTSKNRDQLLQDIQARVRDKLEKAGSWGNRNVVSLLKVRVTGVTEKGDNINVCKGMMSIWKPNDAIREVIKEGAWIDVMNVVPTAVRYSEIQISAGRQSAFNASRYKEPEKFKPYTKVLQRQCYPIKNLSQNPSMLTDYNEIDTVGLIFLIDPSIKEFDSTKQSFQNVYMSDADKNIICLNFWGGLQKFGYQNVLDTGQVIACVNLQKRAGNTRKSIPQFRVTEFSYFTQTPKNDVAKKMLDDFNKKFFGLDRRKFCQDCVVFKNNYLLTKNNENISPYRFMNTDINMAKNKLFIDSPLLRTNKDENFNLTGLDFESTFKQDSELSEEMLKRKKKVNEKIARLKMYGEPPPLSPIHIINRSKQACSSYKSPLVSSNNNSNNSIQVNDNSNLKTTEYTRPECDSSKNVTSIEKTPQKCGVQCEINNSPVLLNRTYVKCVNPVKINFDVQENNDSNIDHFADEFEGSPPLSLD